MSLFYSVLFLISILLLGILLAPFLGSSRLEGMSDMSSNSVDMSSNSVNKTSSTNTNSSSYDNYNHFTGSSTPLLKSSTFYSKEGATLAVNMNGTNTLTMTDKSGKSIIYAGVPSFNGTIDTFMGPNGSVAVVVIVNDTETIVIKDTTGNETIYSSKPSMNGPNNVLPNVTPSSTPSTLIAPTSTQSQSSNWFQGTSTPTQSNYPTSSSSNSYDYSSSLPPGIPASQIPSGREDLYILKSEVVPPVCPVCPVQTSKKKCPPCPACARCPEPAYDCKLVPNYSVLNGNAPVPVLNDFSTFGM